LLQKTTAFALFAGALAAAVLVARALVLVARALVLVARALVLVAAVLELLAVVVLVTAGVVVAVEAGAAPTALEEVPTAVEDVTLPPQAARSASAPVAVTTLVRARRRVSRGRHGGARNGDLSMARISFTF